MISLILTAFIILFILVIVVIWLSVYNGIISLQHRVDKAWYNIDSLLKQRHDELPNLVSVCKEYMLHEQELLHAITLAREEYLNASKLNDKMEWDHHVSRDIQKIVACAEKYPDLKANAHYNYVFCRLKQLEDNIADARILYNDYVTNYNIRVQSFPDAIIAYLAGCEKALFFRVRGNSQLINDVTFNPDSENKT